jgi:hypothetical protein
MANEFDAAKEADKMEKLAKDRMHEDDPEKGKEIGKQLCEEWLSMDQQQRNAVAEQLNQKYNNDDWNTLPVPEVLISYTTGDAWGVRFRPSNLDFSAGDYDVEVVSPDDAGKTGSERIVGMFDLIVDYEVKDDTAAAPEKQTETK